MAITQKHREIAIATPLGEDVLLLTGMTGIEQLGRPFNYELDMLSENHQIKFEDIIGQNVTVRIQLTKDKARYFNGYVSRFTQTPGSHRLAKYQATVVPWLWFLTRTSDCRIFQEMTAPDIIKKVFRDHGFTDFQDNLSGSYHKWEYCVQYRETDFSFVSRLMEQEGIYYYFEHQDSKHLLVLADSVNSHEPYPSYEQISYRPPDKSVSSDEIISTLTVETSVQPCLYSLNDFDFKNTKKDLQTRAKIAREHAAADFEIYDYPGEYTESGDGENYARTRIEELQSQYELIKAVSDSRGICTGYNFTLAEYPRQDRNKKYLITSANYTIDSDDFDSSAHGGGKTTYSCSFAAIDAAQPFRTLRTTPKPSIPGPQTAIIVGPSGEEIYTDEYGRVKVQFHWDRYGKADENSSCWIRVAQVWAGKKWGAMYIPRIGQEVIIEFLEGDPDRPIITGRVYNGQAMPPYDLPSEKTKSTLKSNSSKGGQGFNEIRFEDKKNNEQIFVHAEKDEDVRVKNDAYEWIGNDRHLIVKQDQFEHVNRNRHETVDNDHVEQIGNDSNLTVKGDVVEEFKKNRTTMVTKTSQLNAKEIIVEGSKKISHKTKTHTIEASAAIHLKAGRINLEASQGLSFKLGGNFVSIDPSGVSITGSMVKINSGGSASAASSAKSVESVDISKPADALEAADDKTGQKTEAQGKSRTPQKVTLSPQKAPDYEPPEMLEPAKVIPLVPVPQPVSNKPCGINKLEVKCGHNRKAGPSNVLQVVAEQTVTEKLERRWGGITVTLEKKYGKHDTIKATAQTNDNSSGGKKQLCSLTRNGSPSNSDWVNKAKESYKALAPLNQSELWPFNAKPKCFYIHGRGCDSISQMIKVESFPSQQHSVKISLKVFEEWVDNINKGWEKWGEKVFSFSPIELKPKIIGPHGTFLASWGWKEDESWMVYYEIAADIGLDPILGISIELSLSMVKLAGLAAGIPPVISDLLAKHIADIILSAAAGCKGSFTGGPRGRFYTNGEERISGSAKLSIEGSAGLKLTGRVGSDYIASASMTLGGEAKVTCEAKADLDRKGLFIQPTVKLDPLTVEVKVKLKAFCIFSKEKRLGKWTPWETMDIYKGEKTKLLPKEA